MNNFRQFQATLIFVAEKHPPEMRENLLEIAEMDRSGAKKFSLILGGGGLFCHKNQSCSKLPELDRSDVKKFSLILGGEAFLPQKPKLLEIAWNG